MSSGNRWPSSLPPPSSDGSGGSAPPPLDLNRVPGVPRATWLRCGCPGSIPWVLPVQRVSS
eukprot:3339764-Amphidinium_carterae.1